MSNCWKPRLVIILYFKKSYILVNDYVFLVLMEESKVSMMKRKSIQEAMNKGESLPPVLEKSKMDSNKQAKYQVKLIGKKCIIQVIHGY